MSAALSSFFFVMCFALFVKVAIGEEQSVFVCGSTGNDINDCATTESPCSSIQAALATLNESTSQLIINTCSGTYNNTGNVGIILPNMPVTIQKYGGNEPAVFNCLNAFPTVFTAINSLSLMDISVGGCNEGINFQSTEASLGVSLTLQTVNIFGCNTGILFDTIQGSFECSDLSAFSNNSVSIQVKEAKTFSVSNTIFTTASNASIIFHSTSTNYITLETITFQMTGGVVFNVNEETQGAISSCIFDAIKSPTIIDIIGGSWNMQETELDFSNVCETGISYYSAASPLNSLVINNFLISACRNALQFNADASLELSNGRIDANETCIDVAITTGVSFDNLHLVNCLFEGILVNYTSKPIEINVSNVNFESTNSLHVVTASESNGTISATSFYQGTRALWISGGQWNVNGVDIVGFIVDFRTDGGLAYLDSGNGLASFNFNNCSFAGGYSSYKGGAIYVDNIQSFIVSSCLFENNAAEVGGAIYLKQFDYFLVTDSTFTDCIADEYGGGIVLESDNGHTVSAYLDNVSFVDNSAQTASAISCCGGESEENCSVNLVYQSSDAVELDNNENSDKNGEDITCEIIQGGSGDEDGSRDDSWVYWVILGSMIGLVSTGVVISLIVYYLYRKRMSYARLD